MKTLGITLVLVAGVLVAHGQAGARQPRVAIWGDADPELADVREKIMGAGSFDAVDALNIVGLLPSSAHTQNYDAILVYGGRMHGWSTATSVAAGNALADFADAGGGVVTATFCLHATSPWMLLGRFGTGGYHVMVPVGSQVTSRQTLGTVHEPEHPLMAGVSSFDGGSSSWRTPVTQLTSGSTLVADWSNGTPLLAAKQLPGMGRRVDLNFYPPSSDVRADFWVAGTDGDVLLANAVTWAVPEPATIAALAAGGLALLRRSRPRRPRGPGFLHKSRPTERS